MFSKTPKFTYDELSNHPSKVLLKAVDHGDISLAKLALDHGANIEINIRGSTPLLIAIRNHDPLMVEALVGWGANPLVRAKHSHGETPLTLAVRCGDISVTELLLNAHVDTEARFDGCAVNSITPLGIAADFGYAKVVRALINAGADIDAVTKRKPHIVEKYAKQVKRQDASKKLNLFSYIPTCNETPLMLVANNGHVEIAKNLLDAGADITVVNSDGETALQIAEMRGHHNIASEIRKYAISNHTVSKTIGR